MHGHVAERQRRIRWRVVGRRSMWVAWVASVLLLVLLLPLGCTNRVIPPARVSDPVQVYLLDHGRTPSLVLPTPEGGMARYVYGDWTWYALRRTNVCTGAAALVWPTQAGIGRQFLEGPPSAEAVVFQVGVVIEELYVIEVERSMAEALHERLEQYFVKHAETMVAVPGFRLDFVHHPERYTYFWNSNHKVSQWLRDLGCEVRGPTFNSIWSVEAGGGRGGVGDGGAARP